MPVVDLVTIVNCTIFAPCDRFANLQYKAQIAARRKSRLPKTG